MPCSFFGWLAGYDKKATVEECIETGQYLARLVGLYADRGVIISCDLHGWLPNGVIPMSMNIATQVMEGLVAAEQGVKSIVPLINLQGHFAQDIADIRVTPKLHRKYLDKFGYKDVIIPGTIGSQVPLYPFPQDVGSAFGYIVYTVTVAAMAKMDACSPKTIDEALGVPSNESHAQTYSAANWVLNVVRQQDIEIDNEEIRQEEKIAEEQATQIIDKVLEMGDGDVTVGIVKGIEAGVLDSPFSINVNVKDKVLGVRDIKGACRYLDFGNLPFSEEIKNFHRKKIAEREKIQGKKVDHYTSIDDFWAISKGSLIGKPENR